MAEPHFQVSIKSWCHHVKMLYKGNACLIITTLNEIDTILKVQVIDERVKWFLHLSGQFKQLLWIYRHMKTSGSFNGESHLITTLSSKFSFS